MKKKKWIYLLFIIGLIYIFYTYFRPIEGNYLITEEYKNSKAYVNDIYRSDEYFKQNILNPSDYYIYEEIITASKERKFEIDISCTNNCQQKLLATFNAIYLDHPELLSYLGSATIDSSGIHYNTYTNLSELKTILGARRIAREIDKIKQKTKDMTDQEKIIYVYDYVASHNYDTLFKFTKENQSAYSFFTGGESVCAGFAKASQLIFQNIEINSLLVLSSNHMWNYVEYEGKYYIFDATMGASLNNKESNQFYDGLGTTTTGKTTGLYEDLYPTVEKTKLKDIFGL